VHEGKPFFEELVKFISSASVLVIIWEAEDIITMSRGMTGVTFGFDAEPGTIRGTSAVRTGTILFTARTVLSRPIWKSIYFSNPVKSSTIN
jgi:nucleoside diphosphate kinase